MKTLLVPKKLISLYVIALLTISLTISLVENSVDYNKEINPEKKAVQDLLGFSNWSDEVLIVKTSNNPNPLLTSEMISTNGSGSKPSPDELVQFASNYIFEINHGKIPRDTQFFFYKKKDGGLEVKVSTPSAEMAD